MATDGSLSGHGAGTPEPGPSGRSWLQTPSSRALVAACLTLAPFLGYAFLSPATYSAQASIIFEPGPTSVPLPAGASDLLRQAALDASILASVAEDFGLGKGASADAEAERRLQQALTFAPVNAQVIAVTMAAPSAEQAQRLCSLVARRAASRATQALAKASTDTRPDAELARSSRELASFLAAHPELSASGTPPAPSAAKSPDTAKLKLERDQLQTSLSQLRNNAATDNPYGNSEARDDGKLMERRIAEIDRRLEGNARASREATSEPSPSPEIDREWRRLREAVAQAKRAQSEPAALLTVRLAGPSIPSTPVKPNRPLVVLLGSLAALLAAVAAGRFNARPPRTTGNSTFPASEARHAGSGSEPPHASEAPRAGSGSEPPHARHQPSGAPLEAGPSASTGSGSDPPIQPHRTLQLASEAEAVLADTILSAQPRIATAAPSAAPIPASPAREAQPARVPPAASPTPPPAAQSPRPALAGFALVPVVPTRIPTPLPPPPGPGEPPHAWQVAYGVAEPAHLDRDAPVPEPQGHGQGGRARSTSRRTQILGSPVAATAQDDGGRAQGPARGEMSVSTPPLSYHHATTPPPPNPHVRHLSTPPYYGQATKSADGRPLTPQPASARPVVLKTQPPLIKPHPVHTNWSPDPSVKFERRRALCDELYPFAVERCFVLGVTGVPEAHLAKCRVAAELAIALAEAHSPRVLLLEGDFQWPSVHEMLRIDMPHSKGFSQQLRASKHEKQDWAVVECSPTLHVIAEGVMRSPGLILSRFFDESVQSFRAYYDFIVIDGPLVSFEVDCRALDFVSDGIVIASPQEGSPSLPQAMSLFPEKRYSRVVGT